MKQRKTVPALPYLNFSPTEPMNKTDDCFMSLSFGVTFMQWGKSFLKGDLCGRSLLSTTSLQAEILLPFPILENVAEQIRGLKDTKTAVSPML